MGTPYLGELRFISWNYAPKGWAFCNGQLLPINQNQALFSILGTTYGGDGRTTFALPDLRSRVPMHWGNSPLSGTGYTLGERAGVENVTLSLAQMAPHQHTMSVNNGNGGSTLPTNNYLALPVLVSDNTQVLNAYVPPGVTPTSFLPSVGQAGGNQPHTNIAPYLCINVIIALQGIFPSRN